MLLIPLILFLISYQLNAQGIHKNNIPSLISEDGIQLKTLFPNGEMNILVKGDSVNTTVNDSLNKITKNITKTIDTDINPVKLGIVCGAAITILGGIYYRWKTAWWNEDNTNFHIYYNHTQIYNVDKIGHLYGGILFAECFGVGLRWAGLDFESSLLYGGLFSTMVYTFVELKDGFAPSWGFDPLDLSGSIIGSYYPYAQRKIPFLQNFNFKWSYYPSNSIYYNNMNNESRNNQFFNDDYEGQTFWLTANLKNLIPQKINSFLPDFLNLALGISVENLSDPLNKHRVFILSPDIDITKLIQTDSDILNEILRLLNYIHLPLPAIRVSPDFKAYAIYLKP
jgi:hypothetical protein